MHYISSLTCLCSQICSIQHYVTTKLVDLPIVLTKNLILLFLDMREIDCFGGYLCLDNHYGFFLLCGYDIVGLILSIEN
jgi:hypothetical protein